MTEIDARLKRGEAREAFTLQVTLDGAPFNLSGATLSLAARKQVGASDAVFEKDHDDFDISQASSGIVSFPISSEDTGVVGLLYVDLRVEFSAASVYKSETIVIEIEHAITA